MNTYQPILIPMNPKIETPNGAIEEAVIQFHPCPENGDEYHYAVNADLDDGFDTKFGIMGSFEEAVDKLQLAIKSFLRIKFDEENLQITNGQCFIAIREIRV
jgi:hypothetical protein